MKNLKNKNKLLIIILIISSLNACKDNEILPNSTLPANYKNQGTIEVKSKNLEITFWDWSAIDGDVIDILVNEKTLVSNKSITESKETIKVKLSEGENWIGVKAINEGTNPPASPHIEIYDGKTTQAFDILAYINQPGGYKIKVNL